MRRYMRVGFFGLVLVVLLCGVYAGRSAILKWIGYRLLPKTPYLPPPWDAIVVMSGRPYERSLQAAEVYWHAPAPVVALGGAHNDDLLAIGYEPSQECALTIAALRSLCVPDSAIHKECVGTSTYEEVLHLRSLCERKGWRRIVIVSSAFHGRRIELLATRWLHTDSLRWMVIPARPLKYSLDNWWQSEEGILMVVEEYAKSAYYRWKGYF
ncbi:MAG: YdcF family protein [Bacteroidia bacterium]|nr:YdcF family protein [Bacteroidia bacterium]